MVEDNEFKDESAEEIPSEESEENKVVRVKLPRGREIIGILDRRLGGNKMMVNCLDGKDRNCRVPGRLKRKLWLRPNDVVIVEPWELDNTKADILFKYQSNQINWLKKNGYLESEGTNEF
jgi:translation initiation factor 1A